MIIFPHLKKDIMHPVPGPSIILKPNINNY